MVNLSYFTALLSPLGESSVTGEVRLFTPDSGPMEGTVCFVGSAANLETGLDSIHTPGGTGSDCTSTNGCGVHVHSGAGPDACTNSTTQGGHWWNDSVLSDDPWEFVGYLETDEEGNASYAGCVPTGWIEDGVNSRAFIVHANDGSRVACGVIEIDETPTFEILTASTTELEESGVASDVTVIKNLFEQVSDGVCFVGEATGLEVNLKSVHGNEGGMDCSATNGCGVHIHSGTGCEDSSTQGGHYYDTDMLAVDPWLIVGYTSSNESGFAVFAECLLTGEDDYEDRPLIVHANDGSRVSCGILAEDEQTEPESSANHGYDFVYTNVALIGVLAFGGLLMV